MIGESERSNSVSIAMAAYPERPPQPTVDRLKSTLTSVHIEWDEGVPGDIEVLGYRLFQVELSSGLVSNVYTGDLNADVKAYSVTGLLTGHYYSFFVQAVNFNGVSEQSEELVVAVCLAPTHIDSPFFIASTKSAITLGWATHTFLGGCPTLGFRLFQSDDDGTTYFEVDQALNTLPYLTQYTVSGLSAPGSHFSFKIEIFNEIGSAVSLPAQIQLASVPDKPLMTPT